jgi:hypothetical protein
MIGFKVLGRSAMHETHLKTARLLAKLMDNQFSFFGIKFGLDTVLGIFPGIGDVISLLVSIHLIWVGIKIDLPKEKLIKMLRNIFIDTVIGSVPIIGDISDIFIKANIKNLEILEAFAKENAKLEAVLKGEIINP